MAVILNFVRDTLSLLNFDSLKKNKNNSISHGFFTVLKKGSISFFYALLAHGVAAPLK